MRVRTFELRLIAVSLTACWTLTAALVLVGYRPGGPVDYIVGLAAGVPAVIAAAGLVWPPVTRGTRPFAAMVSLGLGALLLLIPSIADVARQLGARGVQTLLPSIEAAYPWALALLATSLFTAFGLARRSLGATSMRRPRLLRGTALAVALTVTAGSAFTAVAMANEVALRDRIATSSRFGPTDGTQEPPACDDPIGPGGTARLGLELEGEIDGRALGTVELAGERSGPNFRWLAYVATTRELGLHGAARLGNAAWIREPFDGWRIAPLAEVANGTVDAHAFGAALGSGPRATAEIHGVAVIEGARARHCRLAIDGPAFRQAFPQVSWLVGEADLSRWRGELDYWIFLDHQVGRIAGSIEGDAGEIRDGALLATIRVNLTATDRGAPVRVLAPGR